MILHLIKAVINPFTPVCLNMQNNHIYRCSKFETSIFCVFLTKIVNVDTYQKLGWNILCQKYFVPKFDTFQKFC